MSRATTPERGSMSLPPTPPSTSRHHRGVSWSANLTSFHHIGDTPTKAKPVHSAVKGILKPTAPLVELAEEKKKQTTPEPEDPLINLTYLSSSVSAILANENVIAAYGTLGLRLRGVQCDEASWPLFQPIRSNRQQLVECFVRDLGRALVNPLKVEEGVEEKVEERAGEKVEESQKEKVEGSPKKRGMSATQIKEARDLCTTTHAALKFLSFVFTAPFLYSAFTTEELTSLVRAVIRIPMAETLPTPNARKTCALAIWVLQSQRLAIDVAETVAPELISAIGRGIRGELGKEGKKGSRGDGLRAIHDLATYLPQVYIPHLTTLLPAVLAQLNSPVITLRNMAAHALGGFTLGYATFRDPEVQSQVQKALLDFLAPVPSATPLIVTASSPKPLKTTVVGKMAGKFKPPAFVSTASASTTSKPSITKKPSPKKPVIASRKIHSAPTRDALILRTLRNHLSSASNGVTNSSIWAVSVVASFVALLGLELILASPNEDEELELYSGAKVEEEDEKSVLRHLHDRLFKDLFLGKCLPTANGANVSKFLGAGMWRVFVWACTSCYSSELFDSESTRELFKTNTVYAMGASSACAMVALAGSASETSKEKPLRLAVEILREMAKRGGRVCGDALNILSSFLIYPPDSPTPTASAIYLLPPTLFSLNPGLLTQLDYSTNACLGNLKEEMKVESTELGSLREMLSHNHSEELWNACVGVWKQGLRKLDKCLEDAGDEDVDPVLSIWTLLLGIKLESLQSADADDNTIESFIFTSVRLLIDVLDECISSSSPSKRKTKPDSATTLVAVRLLWDRTISVFSAHAELLANPAELLSTWLMQNHATFSSACEWAELSASVILHAPADVLPTFWGSSTWQVSAAWPEDTRTLVWNAFATVYAHAQQGSPELLAVLLSGQIASEAWEVWDQLLVCTFALFEDVASALDGICSLIKGEGNVSAALATRLVDSMLTHLETEVFSIVPEVFLRFVNGTFLQAYPPTGECKLTALWMIRSFLKVLEVCPPMFVEDVFSICLDGLRAWISGSALDADEYEYDIVPLYVQCLLTIQEIPEWSAEVLHALVPILEAPFLREHANRDAMRDSFDEFWEQTFSASELQVPDSITRCFQRAPSPELLLPSLELSPSPQRSPPSKDKDAEIILRVAITPPHTPSRVPHTPPPRPRSNKLFTPAPFTPLLEFNYSQSPRSPVRRRERDTFVFGAGKENNFVFGAEEKTSTLKRRVSDANEEERVGKKARADSSPVLDVTPTPARMAASPVQVQPMPVEPVSVDVQPAILEIAPVSLEVPPVVVEAPSAPTAPPTPTLSKSTKKRKFASVFVEVLTVQEVYHTPTKTSKKKKTDLKRTRSETLPLREGQAKVLRRTRSSGRVAKKPKRFDDEQDVFGSPGTSSRQRKRIKLESAFSSDDDSEFEQPSFESSDDDPHLGQVTPHHLISPELARRRVVVGSSPLSKRKPS